MKAQQRGIGLGVPRRGGRQCKLEGMVGIAAGAVQEGKALIDGVSLRYVTTGQGPPVVLVHGLAGNLSFWSRNLDALGRAFTVYAVDLPGHGGSSDAPDYGLPHAVRLMRGFLDHVKVDRASLVGGSLGGLVALETALTFPERVDRLVLVDSAGLGSHVPWTLRVLTVPIVGELLAHPTTLTVQVFMRQSLSARSKATVASLWGQGYPPWRAGALLRILRYGVDWRGIKPWARRDGRLAQVSQPTLIIWGARDKVFPPAYAQRAHRLLPGSRLHIVAGSGHLPQWERPEEFNAVVTRFLQGHLP